MKTSGYCSINAKLLPYKAHYFLIFGAYGGALPYMPILAKELGLSATAVGVTYSVLPIFTFVARPFFGFLADYFRNIKVFLIALLFSSGVFVIPVLFVPPLDNKTQESAHVLAEFPNASHSFIVLPHIYGRSCLEIKFQDNMKCFMSFDEEQKPEDNRKQCELYLNKPYNMKNIYYTQWQNDSSDSRKNISKDDIFLLIHAEYHSKRDYNCSDFKHNSFSVNCNPDINDCVIQGEQQSPLKFSTYQFWIFMILVIIAGSTAEAAMSLTDTASYDALGEEGTNFGKQRLWGAVGNGIVCPAAGILNDVASSYSPQKDFSPGFYLMVACIFVDMLLLAKLSINKSKFTTNIYKDLKRILSSTEIIIFAFGVFIIGALNAIIATYEFWYLEDLGASQLLLGLTVAMQCIIGEVPFFFVSGWFMKKFGHFLCLVCSFAAFSLRLGLYSLVKNPWVLLPIDILHGLTFAILCATMTSFASTKCPPGLEATLLGFLSGLYQGLGFCAGSLLGGIGFEKLGGRNLFLVGSAVSLLSAPLFGLAHLLLKKRSCVQEHKMKNLPSDSAPEKTVRSIAK